VAADAEDVGPFLGGEGVVERNPDRRALAQVPDDPSEEQAADLVRLPGAAREESMERLVVAPAGDARRHQRLRHGVRPAGQRPAGEDHHHVGEARPSESRSNHFQRVEQCAKSLVDHRRPPLQRGNAEEDHVARIGTIKRPAILRVQTERRAKEVAAICGSNGIHFLIGLEPDKPEDVSDMDRALRAPKPAVASPKVGRNDPCPCGSGKKFKKCCAATLPPGA
jgi:SWIM/SEC-C metal-binding protein